MRIACCKHKCYVLCLCFFTFILMRFIDYDMHIIIIPIDCNHVINFQFLLPAFFCLILFTVNSMSIGRTYVGLVTDISRMEVNRVPLAFSYIQEIIIRFKIQLTDLTTDISPSHKVLRWNLFDLELNATWNMFRCYFIAFFAYQIGFTQSLASLFAPLTLFNNVYDLNTVKCWQFVRYLINFNEFL